MSANAVDRSQAAETGEDRASAPSPQAGRSVQKSGHFICDEVIVLYALVKRALARLKPG
jgi:hypothetical protein